MLFSETERRELAKFFAKRFSEPQVRSMLARQAGIKEDPETTEPNVAWEALITAAQNRKKLRCARRRAHAVGGRGRQRPDLRRLAAPSTPDG